MASFIWAYDNFTCVPGSLHIQVTQWLQTEAENTVEHTLELKVCWYESKSKECNREEYRKRNFFLFPLVLWVLVFLYSIKKVYIYANRIMYI